MNLWPLLGVVLILTTSAAGVWLLINYPAVVIAIALVVTILLLVEWRRARRPNPFGASFQRVQFDGDNRCPNCVQPIEDHDAVRARDGIVWHERCARQLEAVGKWERA